MRNERPRKSESNYGRSRRPNNEPRYGTPRRHPDEEDWEKFADDGERMYSEAWQDNSGRDQYSRPYDEEYEEENEEQWRPRRSTNNRRRPSERGEYREGMYGQPYRYSYGVASSHEFGDYGRRYQMNQAPKDWYEDTGLRPNHKNSTPNPKRWSEPSWGGTSPGEPNYAKHTSVSPSSITKSYWGVGPKGYKRADERIHEDVCSRLAEDHHLDASEIIVEVNEGEVFLRGKVEDRRSKHHAEHIAEQVSGTTNIINELRVMDKIHSFDKKQKDSGKDDKTAAGKKFA